MNLKDLKQEQAILKEDAKLQMAKKVLESALNIVDHKLGIEGLNAPTPIQKEENEESNVKKGVLLVLGAACIGGLAMGIGEFVKSRQEEKAVQKDQEQKELYRKLVQVKGRV